MTTPSSAPPPEHAERAERAELHDRLIRSIAEIMAEWTAVAAEEPWIALPREYRLNSLPLVLTTVFDATFGGGDADALAERLAQAAAEHGESRRGQGFDTDLLFREYYFLRHAIERYLCEVLRQPRCHELLLDVDYVLTTAQRQSLYGFHRAELERTGQWAEVTARARGELLALRTRRANG